MIALAKIVMAGLILDLTTNESGLMKYLLKLTVCLAGLGLCVPSASAQFSNDDNAPVTGSADDVDYRPNLTIFSGQVDVRQGEVRVLCDKMRVHTAGSDTGGNAIGGANKIEAIGNFFYLTPEQEVRGDKGVYLKSNETFTVTGNVILLQGEGSVVTGEKLIYDLKSRNAKVLGSCKGRKCGSKGRVNILLKNTDANANG